MYHAKSTWLDSQLMMQNCRNSSRLQQASGGVPFSGDQLNWSCSKSDQLVGKRAVAKDVDTSKLMLDYLEPQLCEWILLCSKEALETVKISLKSWLCDWFYNLFLQEKAFENLFFHLYWQPYPFDSCGLEVDWSCNLRISQTESPCLGIQFYSWAILILPSLRSSTSLQSSRNTATLVNKKASVLFNKKALMLVN